MVPTMMILGMEAPGTIQTLLDQGAALMIGIGSLGILGILGLGILGLGILGLGILGLGILGLGILGLGILGLRIIDVLKPHFLYHTNKIYSWIQRVICM